MSRADAGRRTVVFGATAPRIEDIVDLADGRATAALADDPAFRARVDGGVRHLNRRLAAGETIYGVTTGFGDSCVVAVEGDNVGDLPRNLVRFHGCGTGRVFDARESAAIVAARLAALAHGWSAVRWEVLAALRDLVNHRVLPQIPCEGSVGASGDLTPLSYVAAALIGERECSYGGEVMTSGAALARAGLSPLALRPKESLALMNGTSVMTALGCLAFVRARRLARACAAITAMASDATLGNRAHFDDRIFVAKPHPGQRRAAAWIREDLEYAPGVGHAAGRVQDRYSIRCAPHVIGVLVDALPFAREVLETELASANDNPLIDPESGDILHGGNFYGGHVCFVMDALKAAVANLADLVDRQVALVCNGGMSNGLPANLVGRAGPEGAAHHGFKAMQISASALAAEALKLTMPASVFSRSTECHNQDKVSMGTIAARDCLRIVELTESVAAIGVLTMCQAVDLRGLEICHRRARAIHAAVRARIPMVTSDRRQDFDVAAVVAMLHGGELPIGEDDAP